MPTPAPTFVGTRRQSLRRQYQHCIDQVFYLMGQLAYSHDIMTSNKNELQHQIQNLQALARAIDKELYQIDFKPQKK